MPPSSTSQSAPTPTEAYTPIWQLPPPRRLPPPLLRKGEWGDNTFQFIEWALFFIAVISIAAGVYTMIT